MIIITTRRRPRNALGGRFGGGWDWGIGVVANHDFREIVVNLVTFSVRIERVKDGEERVR